MEKKVKCGAKSIQDCLNCPYPDCIVENSTPMKFETKALRRAEYMKAYVRNWRHDHPTYNRDKMREYRARQKTEVTA